MGLEIYKVSPDKLVLKQTLPQSLIINSDGFVMTTGWSNGKLVPRTYLVAPVDGYYEFDFIANTPIGITLNKITQIKAEPFIWANFPSDLKGVRIHAASNYVVRDL